MTPSEFKAWFDGFCEAIGEQPTQEQWAKVKAKVEALAGPTLTLKGWTPAPWTPYQPVKDTTGLPLVARYDVSVAGQNN